MKEKWINFKNNIYYYRRCAEFMCYLAFEEMHDHYHFNFNIIKYYIQEINNKERMLSLLNEYNILSEACRNNNIEAVTFLLEYGVDINENSGSPLYIACGNGNIRLILLLIENGANTKIDGLLDANNNSDIIRLLLENGANINNNKALIRACRNNNIDTVILLLENGADANLEGSCKETPLHIACNNNNVALASLLLKYGANANLEGSCKETPLHRACKNNNVELARLLLKYGADANLEDSCKNTPLHIACKNNNLELARLLLKYGANANLGDNYNRETPLYRACNNNNVELARLLLKYGADANLERMIGGCKNTPLHIACKNNNLELAHLLLKYGADPYLKNLNQQTSLDLAYSVINIELINLMEEHSFNSSIKKSLIETLDNKNFKELFALLNQFKNANIIQLDSFFHNNGIFNEEIEKLNNTILQENVTEEVSKIQKERSDNHLNNIKKIRNFVKDIKEVVRQGKKAYITSVIAELLCNNIGNTNSHNNQNTQQDELLSNIQKIPNEIRLIIAEKYANSLSPKDLQKEAIKFTQIVGGANKTKYKDIVDNAQERLKNTIKNEANQLYIS